jgi:hypothetical protein
MVDLAAVVREEPAAAPAPPPLKSQATFDSYKRIIEARIGPKLGGLGCRR